MFPAEEDYQVPEAGMVARLREGIREPEQIHYTSFETMLAPDPWHRGCVIVIGDAAHCTTPHLAAGAAMCLEDAIALGEELASRPAIGDALAAFCERRFDRCRYVGETAAQLSYWQLHPGTPGRRPSAGYRRGIRAAREAILITCKATNSVRFSLTC